MMMMMAAKQAVRMTMVVVMAVRMLVAVIVMRGVIVVVMIVMIVPMIVLGVVVPVMVVGVRHGAYVSPHRVRINAVLWTPPPVRPAVAVPPWPQPAA